MSIQPELLRESFALVVERQPELTRRFYAILFERYPQVRPLFGRNGGDKQAQMLQDALVAVVDNLDNAAWLQQTLSALGQKHVGYGVTDEMYDWVGDSLLTALAEAAGPDWTPQLRAAWSDAYRAIAGVMQAAARCAEV